VTQENKDKKIKKHSSLKDELFFRDDHQDYDETAYLLKSPKNAMLLLESIESLKEGKVVSTSLSKLSQK
jgi:hypothetical protein